MVKEQEPNGADNRRDLEWLRDKRSELTAMLDDRARMKWLQGTLIRVAIAITTTIITLSAVFTAFKDMGLRK